MPFEEYLKSRLPQNSSVDKAMAYSLLAPGKRVRPKLLLKALEDYGIEETAGYPAAAALEMIHTYSLIHDDLPAMDNDDLRRGRPSCHKAFTEADAILAGDGLLTLAFLTASQSEKASDIVRILAENAGPEGMILGQCLDIAGEGKSLTLDEVLEMDGLKTGCLLAAPLQCAAVLAGHPEDEKDMARLGKLAGLQFQILDDILDVTSSPEIMGKSLSDDALEKSTSVSLLGIEGAKKLAASYQAEMDAILSRLHLQGSLLASYLESLLHRSR